MIDGRKTRTRVFGLSILLSLGIAASAQATTIVLYDGALGGLPSDQGMIFAGLPTPTSGGGATNLNTTAGNIFQAGFGAFRPLALDPTLGYTLEFTAQILTESHTGNPVRAGFSVIMIGAGPTASIEIGFQDGRIFAQNDAPLFGDPPANSNATFNPVGMGFVNYSLAVLGGAYTLSADGTPVLGGGLRDYTGFGLPPYIIPGSIFLGDNTTSAQANINLSRVALVVPDAVPEPATLLLLIFGLAVIAVRRSDGLLRTTSLG